MSEKKESIFSDIQSAIRQFVDERDWDQFHSPKDLAISLSLESAEVLEHFQWKNEDEVKEHIEKHKGDLAEELVDVMWFVILLAKKLDIDIADAFSKKLAKNIQKYPTTNAKGNHKKYTEFK